MSDTLNYCEECHIIFEDWVLQYHEYPTQCPSCRRDDLISFNSADIDILDRIDNPIEGDEWETAASGEITRLRADNAKLREALEEVMTWIDNWDPVFCEDDEWDDTKNKVSAAIKKEEETK